MLKNEVVVLIVENRAMLLDQQLEYLARHNIEVILLKKSKSKLEPAQANYHISSVETGVILKELDKDSFKERDYYRWCYYHFHHKLPIEELSYDIKPEKKYKLISSSSQTPEDLTEWEKVFNEVCSDSSFHYYLKDGLKFDSELQKESLNYKPELNGSNKKIWANSITKTMQKHFLNPDLYDSEQLVIITNFYLSFRLHRYVWLKHLRPFLNQICNAIMKDCADWRLHLVLHIFHRFYQMQNKDRWPDSIKNFLCLPINYQQIEILPPATNQVVAIFLPTYNRVELFKRVVLSLQKQTWTQWKAYIYDDASEDDTENFCRQLIKSDSRFIYKRNDSNKGFFGIHQTCREMIDNTDAAYFASLADDDFWLPNHLELMMAQFKVYPWICEVYGSFTLMLNNKQPIGQFGSWIEKATITNNQFELIQALNQDMCPVGYVARKIDFSDFEIYDYTSQKYLNASYIPYDFMLHVKLLAHYEFAHHPISTLQFNVSTTTTQSSQWDSLQDFLKVGEEIKKDYERLFEKEKIPFNVLQNYMLRRIQVLTNDIVKNIGELNPNEWNDFKIKMIHTWELLFNLYGRLLLMSSPSSANRKQLWLITPHQRQGVFQRISSKFKRIIKKMGFRRYFNQ